MFHPGYGPEDRVRAFSVCGGVPYYLERFAVLRSIAHGHDRNSQISQRVGLEAAHVTKVLHSLERLGLVERLRPITASPRDIYS